MKLHISHLLTIVMIVTLFSCTESENDLPKDEPKTQNDDSENTEENTDAEEETKEEIKTDDTEENTDVEEETKEEIETENTEENTTKILTSFEEEILTLINNHRLSINLRKLETSAAVKKATDQHTDYMISRGTISHDNFSSRASSIREETQAFGVAENVALGYTTAESVVNGWLNSPGHRENIEGNYTHSSITAKQNSSGRWYYTHIFIRK